MYLGFLRGMVYFNKKAWTLTIEDIIFRMNDEVVLSSLSLANAELFVANYKLLEGIPENLKQTLLNQFLERIIITSRIESGLRQQEAMIELGNQMRQSL